MLGTEQPVDGNPIINPSAGAVLVALGQDELGLQMIGIGTLGEKYHGFGGVFGDAQPIAVLAAELILGLSIGGCACQGV